MPHPLVAGLRPPYPAAMLAPAPPPRPPRYAEALVFLAGRERVRLAELARGLGIGPEVADVFLSCLLAEGRIGPRGLDGWWPVREAAAEMPARPEAAPAPGALARLEAALRQLEAVAMAVGIRARAAEARAALAERRLAALQRQARAAPEGEARFQALKRLLARELHPDQPAAPEEQRWREALFKRLWPRLEVLERGGGK
ncbi:hypothetical protein JYK14_23400 [Siccirubricoccus sp. KC 17139]|uniref:Uncharacterized protein n=1 Tax=Siccirubricoccus soli TaxID=2899147 RepID=A0ABT1DAV9_9PROT|nr:hypothetical protein [Siccirubricoccus soli]MCO6419082.1 hypothetical protein [Siccirubricoccus soli]MCP2685217.1 hypothetical protein [Siccirubricoccus soli]